MFLNLTSWSLAGDSERVSLEPKNVLAILDPTTVIINEYNTAISYEPAEKIEHPANVITN